MFIGAWATMRIAGVSRLLAGRGDGRRRRRARLRPRVSRSAACSSTARSASDCRSASLVGAVAEARWPTRADAGAGCCSSRPSRSPRSGRWRRSPTRPLTVLAVVARATCTWPRRRTRRARRWSAGSVRSLAACLVAHVAVRRWITLAGPGELPDWGWYLNTLREFLLGRLGDLTYDFSPWSPALAVGALYLVSGRGAGGRPAAGAERRCARSGTLLFAIAGDDGLRRRPVHLHRQPLQRPHHPLRLPARRHAGRPLADAARAPGPCARGPAVRRGMLGRCARARGAAGLPSLPPRSAPRFPQSALAYRPARRRLAHRGPRSPLAPAAAPAQARRGRGAARPLHAGRERAAPCSPAPTSASRS